MAPWPLLAAWGVEGVQGGVTIMRRLYPRLCSVQSTPAPASTREVAAGTCTHLSYVIIRPHPSHPTSPNHN